MRAVYILYVMLCFACTNQNTRLVTGFDSGDLPIHVSCADGDIECVDFENFLQESISNHNSLLNRDVFYYIGSNENIDEINVIANQHIYNDDGSINSQFIGQTNYEIGFIRIELSPPIFNTTGLLGPNRPICLIMHELGHALGHAEHTEEGLMSSTADCQSQGWYDDFYDWFQENYQ